MQKINARFNEITSSDLLGVFELLESIKAASEKLSVYDYDVEGIQAKAMKYVC